MTDLPFTPAAPVKTLPHSPLVNNLLATVTRYVETAKKRLDRYSARLKEDAFLAVSDTNPFRPAAEIDVWCRVKALTVHYSHCQLSDGQILAKLQDHFRDQLQVYAEDLNSERTDRPFTNIARREQLAVYADVLRLIRSVI